MTSKEQKTVNELYDSVRNLQSENVKFKELLDSKVTILDNKVNKKHLPLTLEHSVVTTVQHAIKGSIEKSLSGYDSPLNKYLKEAVDSNSDTIKELFNSVVTEGFSSEEFRESCKTHILNKIARNVISGLDGSVDKVVIQMKQDSIFRSKLTLMVNTLVSEYLSK